MKMTPSPSLVRIQSYLRFTICVTHNCIKFSIARNFAKSAASSKGSKFLRFNFVHVQSNIFKTVRLIYKISLHRLPKFVDILNQKEIKEIVNIGHILRFDR